MEGRRKPIAFTAIASMCIFLLGVGFATDIPTTIVCFWLLDISTNALMDPCRALLANLLPDVAMQTQANFTFVFAGGLARGLGFLIGAYTSDGDAAARMHVVYCAAALYVGVVGVLSMLWLPEAPVLPHAPTNLLADAGGGVVLIAQSKVLRLAFVAQLLSFLGWVVVFIYGAEWLAEEAFEGGEPGDAAFVLALGWANLTLAGMSFLAAAVALVLLLRGLPPAPLWAAGLGSMAGSLTVMGTATWLGWRGAWLCIPVLLLGLTWVCTDAIPWLMVSEEVAFNPAFEGFAGRVVAGFNLSQCLPGMVGAVLFGPMQQVTHSLAPLLLFGAAAAAVGAGVAWMTREELGVLGYDALRGAGPRGDEGERALERKDGKEP